MTSYIQIFRKSLCIISDFFIEPDLHPCFYTLCSSSVGQSIVYQLADIRGMALWYDKFGVLGLSAGPIQQAITAAGTFMLKASELQQSVVFMSILLICCLCIFQQEFELVCIYFKYF